MGNAIYNGGGFTSVGKQTRNNVAAVDSVIGAVTDWDPNANVRVAALAVGDAVYVGGAFTSVGGSSRRYLAAVDLSTGVLRSWDPSPNWEVNALLVSGTHLFAGGRFPSVGAESAHGFVALYGE